jgi:hypothetical protein
MMTAGRSLSSAGRGLIFQAALVACYIIFMHLYTPNIKLTEQSVSLQITQTEKMKALEYIKATTNIQYIFGSISLLNLTLVGISLMKAGKCIQRHWKYFGVEH